MFLLIFFEGKYFSLINFELIVLATSFSNDHK